MSLSPRNYVPLLLDLPIHGALLAGSIASLISFLFFSVNLHLKCGCMFPSFFTSLVANTAAASVGSTLQYMVSLKHSYCKTSIFTAVVGNL